MLSFDLIGKMEEDDILDLLFTLDFEKSDSSAGGLLVPEAIISPVVSDLAMIWFNRYMYY
jgi:hypothetical protein